MLDPVIWWCRGGYYRPPSTDRVLRADDIRPYTKCRLHFVGAAISYLKFVTCF